MKILVLLLLQIIFTDNSSIAKIEDDLENSKLLEETMDLPHIQDEEALLKGLSDEIEKHSQNRDDTISLEKNFDVEAFLKTFGEFECGEQKHILNFDDPQCKEQFKKELFDIVGHNEFSSSNFFKHLELNIHKPLGMDVTQSMNFEKMITNLVAQKKSTIFEKIPNNINYKTFQDSIIRQYMDIVSKTNDVDGNKSAISEMIISILKKCHIYWNTMRAKNQVKQAYDDTLELVKNLSKFYNVKKQMLSNVTKVLLTNIRSYFYRFKKADTMFDVVGNSSAKIISDRIINRYVNQIERIKTGTYDQVYLNRELSYHMDLFITYMVMNYYAGESQPDIRMAAENNIITRTIQSYNSIKTMVQSFDQNTKNDMKQFTVILLLKYKHFIFIVLNLHAIPNFALTSDTDQVVNKATTVIVLEELKNNLILIPKTCVNFFILKTCTLQETNRILNYVTGKFMLKRSMSGWRILNYIEGVLKYMYEEANMFTWSNFYVYKQYFYQNLFLAISHIAKHFMINQDDSLDELDQMLGEVIRQAQNELGEINMKLMDIFDLQLYEEMLRLRGKFNVNVPYNKDALVITSIQNQLYKFLQDFQVKFSKDINGQFLQFLKVIKEKIIEWKKGLIQGSSLTINPATLPLTAKSLNMKIVHQEAPQKLIETSDHDVNQALILEKLEN